MTLTNNKPNPHEINAPRDPRLEEVQRLSEATAEIRVTDEPTARPKRVGVILTGGLLALLLVGAAAWYFVIREVAPAEVNSAEAVAARAEAASSAAPAGDGADGIAGTWSIDTTIGDFNESCLTEVCTSTFAGFRIDEVLSGFGDKTVVGRTPGVTGQVTIDGTVVTGGEFVVDMTGLITDSGARTGALRSQAIETDAFPTATFQLTAPVDLGRVPAIGEQLSVVATGDLTVHGVTRSVEIPLSAQLENGVIVVFGRLDLVLGDFDIDTPSAPVVVSVDDTAVLELQLFLTR